MEPSKLLRSLLFVPGNREAWIAKAPQYGADALILDLEDAVPPDEKVPARQIVRRALDTMGTAGHTLWVRPNGLETGLFEDDLEAVVSPGLYSIILPKVRTREDVVRADILLGFFERRAGMEVGKVFLRPGLETAPAIRDAYDIAKASPRVDYMGFGHVKSADPARSIGFVWTRERKETLFIRAKVLLDLRAAGVRHPMAAPWSDIKDLEGLREYSLEMRQLGYTGGTALHPGQVPIMNEVYTPAREEIAYWQGVVAAMEEAEKVGRAAVLYEGQLIDIAMAKTAQDMLEMARRLGIVD
ncbi:MAG: CoA ester lyase [Chloroflexi bacterium]|nr:CoA ester lyase [Chloroflexota bacterium]